MLHIILLILKILGLLILGILGLLPDTVWRRREKIRRRVCGEG